MTFCDLTIYNDNPLLIRLCTELDLSPNFEWFPYNICDGFGMPTGDAYSSGHLVLSHLGFANVLLLRPLTLSYITTQIHDPFPDFTPFLDLTPPIHDPFPDMSSY